MKVLYFLKYHNKCKICYFYNQNHMKYISHLFLYILIAYQIYIYLIDLNYYFYY